MTIAAHKESEKIDVRILLVGDGSFCLATRVIIEQVFFRRGRKDQLDYGIGWRCVSGKSSRKNE